MPQLGSQDYQGLIAGTDEAGRGPLAGEVVAAAVILDRDRPIEGLDDSKKLSESKREKLFEEIQLKAKSWSIAVASVEEIDRINILQASLLAMRRSVEALSHQPSLVLVDGNRLPDWSYNAEAVVGGDAKYTEIAAASILAKVTRDREMKKFAEIYPEYGFEKHKGYPTKAHMLALEKNGPCPIHRRSFAPVQQRLL